MNKARRILSLTLAFMLIVTTLLVPVYAENSQDKHLRIEFTSDMHSHVDVSSGEVCGEIRARGGIPSQART